MKALITFTAVLAFSSASFADAGKPDSRRSGALYPEWLIHHDG
ncbi:hypothetical protein [Metapseudomonas sp. CR1201]|jgi:hypothetical protein